MGSHTYIKIYHHLIWATKNRSPMIEPHMQERLYNYIGGIMAKRDWHLLAIGGVSDHIHIFFYIQKMHDISEIVRCIKANSSQFMRYNFSKEFAWQNGYGWFSCTGISVSGLKQYILNQKDHHTKESFNNEINRLLNG